MTDSNKNILLAPLPFPNIYWWQNVLDKSCLIWDENTFYQKMTFQNKYEISTANGKLLLSIPLEKGRNQKNKLQNVQICYRENWQDIHWRSIASAYGRSPYFEFYADKIRSLYTEKITHLWTWNMLSINIINELLVLHLDFDSTVIKSNSDHLDKIDLRYLSKKSNHKKPVIEPYIQPFSDRNGYIDNLSILDLLFCKGPRGLLK